MLWIFLLNYQWRTINNAANVNTILNYQLGQLLFYFVIANKVRVGEQVVLEDILNQPCLVYLMFDKLNILVFINGLNISYVMY